MSDFLEEFINEPQSIYNPYYQLETGEVYDKDAQDFVDKESSTYKEFLSAGGEPLSIGEKGYTLEQLKRSVLKFYGWPIGECLLTVDELRTKLQAELEAESAKFEENLNKDMFFTSSLGFKVNGDRRTRSNIEDLISMLTNDITPVSYRDFNNQEQKLTRPQLKTIRTEHLQNGLDLYQQKWQKQAELQVAKSKEELKTVNLEFTFKDYSIKE